MRCYYHFNEETKTKILIPYCWNVLHSNNKGDCTCQPDTFAQFEKERYNKVIAEKCAEINGMRDLINQLNKRIEFLSKKK